MTNADTIRPPVPARGYRRFAGVGTGAGLIGGICCMGSAIAVGAGVGGLSFFTTWMNRYQLYLVVAGVVVMAAWLIRLVRRTGAGRGYAAAARAIWRQALVMGAMYALTLVIAIMVSGLIRGV